MYGLKRPSLHPIVMLSMLLSWGSCQPEVMASEQKVNPALLDLQLKQKPLLRKLGARVYATEFIGYSNHGFIEGDTGIIVVDGGWFPSTTSRAIEELRRFTDKPVVAIIYTHLHLDHFGGMGPIMAGQSADIPVYGPQDWQQWVVRLLKTIGPSPIPEPNDPLSYPPTIDVGQPIDVDIDGVPLRLMPMEGDVSEHLWVWLPEDRILFSGDSPPHGVFPAVETARFEIGRNPDEMLKAVETSLALSPTAIVPGHSRILQGREDIDSIMTMNRDAIGFLIDQVNRYYLSHRSVDELLDTQHLPPAIANHPEFQPYYHRWEWFEEARRLVPLLGGRDRILALAETSVEGDPRWAARLANYVMQVDSDDSEARSVRQKAFLKVAQTTNSANERNYLLGLILEENGTIDFARQLGPLNRRAYSSQTNFTLLKRLKTRFRAEAADAVELRVNVGVGEEYFTLIVMHNVLRVVPIAAPESVDIAMRRDDLVAVIARTKTLNDLPGWDGQKTAPLTALIE